MFEYVKEEDHFWPSDAQDEILYEDVTVRRNLTGNAKDCKRFHVTVQVGKVRNILSNLQT